MSRTVTRVSGTRKATCVSGSRKAKLCEGCGSPCPSLAVLVTPSLSVTYTSGSVTYTYEWATPFYGGIAGNDVAGGSYLSYEATAGGGFHAYGDEEFGLNVRFIPAEMRVYIASAGFGFNSYIDVASAPAAGTVLTFANRSGGTPYVSSDGAFREPPLSGPTPHPFTGSVVLEWQDHPYPADFDPPKLSAKCLQLTLAGSGGLSHFTGNWIIEGGAVPSTQCDAVNRTLSLRKPVGPPEIGALARMGITIYYGRGSTIKPPTRDSSSGTIINDPGLSENPDYPSGGINRIPATAPFGWVYNVTGQSPDAPGDQLNRTSFLQPGIVDATLPVSVLPWRSGEPQTHGLDVVLTAIAVGDCLTMTGWALLKRTYNCANPFDPWGDATASGATVVTNQTTLPTGVTPHVWFVNSGEPCNFYKWTYDRTDLVNLPAANPPAITTAQRIACCGS